MRLQESGEMYLETILVLSQRQRYVRSIDVADYMGYSKPSVSRAVSLLKQGEYILQRALGAAPKETQLGAYLNLYRKLCEITNLPLSSETEAKLNDLIDSIYARLFESAPPSEEIRIEEEQALQDYYADIGDE